MRFFARIHAAIIFAIALLVYLTHSWPSLHALTRAKKVWNHSTTRLVVFGDSWSTHRQSVFLDGESSDTPAAPGRLWVDVLCSEVVCDDIYDYAQSIPSQRSHYRGPVVDNEVYGNATRHPDLNSTSMPCDVPDVKTQLDQFLSDDFDVEPTISNATVRSSTIFTIFVGVWEVWAYVELTDSAAETAVLESIASLFVQLDKLVHSGLVQGTRPTIIIPKVPDPTWFPRWFTERTGPNGTDKYGFLQRGAVTLTSLWNHILETEAERYQGATIILPDFNQWLLDQMRLSQRGDSVDPISTNLLAQYGNKQTGGFTDVRQPCVNYTASDEGVQATCSDPSNYLFWDDTRLTGGAHELLGKHVAHLLRNQTIVDKGHSTSVAGVAAPTTSVNQAQSS